MPAHLTMQEIVRLGRGKPKFPCSHPRIPENTVSVGKAGTRCRLCRRAIGRRCANKKRGTDHD